MGRIVGLINNNTMKHYEGITEEQQKQLIDIFTNCPLCVIRDTLIDAKIIDEDFPILYNSVVGLNKTVVKARYNKSISYLDKKMDIARKIMNKEL